MDEEYKQSFPGTKIEKEKITFRQFEDKDWQEMYDLNILGLQSASTFTSDPEKRKKFDKDLENVRANYLEKRGEFLLAIYDDKIVGMGALREVDKTTGEIKRMRTLPSLQGQGIGRMILEKLIDRARELGYRRLILDVNERAERARRLYESLGFKEYRRGAYFLPGDIGVFYSLEI